MIKLMIALAVSGTCYLQSAWTPNYSDAKAFIDLKCDGAAVAYVEASPVKAPPGQPWVKYGAPYRAVCEWE